MDQPFQTLNILELVIGSELDVKDQDEFVRIVIVSQVPRPNSYVPIVKLADSVGFVLRKSLSFLRQRHVEEQGDASGFEVAHVCYADGGRGDYFAVDEDANIKLIAWAAGVQNELSAESVVLGRLQA